MFIVWTEAHDGTIKAQTKKSRLAAKRAYNAIDRGPTGLKSYGWSIAHDAGPQERRAAGLTPFWNISEGKADCGHFNPRKVCFEPGECAHTSGHCVSCW